MFRAGIEQKCRVEIGGGGECRNMGRKRLDRMTLKLMSRRDVWNAKS